MTLGTQLILYTVLLLYVQQGNNKGMAISNLDPSYTGFVKGSLFSIGGTPIPNYVLFAIVLTAVMWFVWNKTTFGKNMFALGSNEEAARVSGVNVFGVTVGVFALAGAMYGFTGFIEGARIGSNTANTGLNYELDAIAACVIGGVSFVGGIGKIRGIVIGVVMLRLIFVGLTMVGVAQDLQYLIKGAIILFACALDMRKYLVKKMISCKDGTPSRAIFALSGTFFAAKRRQKQLFFSLQSRQFAFGLPLELEKHGHTVSLRFTSWYNSRKKRLLSDRCFSIRQSRRTGRRRCRRQERRSEPWNCTVCCWWTTRRISGRVSAGRMDWLGLGFSLVGEAANGQDALELAESLRPDVILTDIKMPFMDGLELCRILTDRLPAARFVVFSGFDAFEYAKQAIQMNVVEYILKPINADELSAVLRRLKDQLDRERAERRNVELLRSRYTENLPILRELFYANLLDGHIEPGTEQERAARLDIDLQGEEWAVGLAYIGSDRRDALSTLSIQNLLEETLTADRCKPLPV